MASARELILAESNDNNKVGTIESILAGVGSGLLAIPKGFFSLGATLLDLGVDEGRAAKVEQFFDGLKYFAFLDARIASAANLDPNLKPAAPGKPILTNASVICPAVVASAF